MQKGYNEIQALEVELRILEQTSAPPSRPRKLTANKIKLSLISNILKNISYLYLYSILYSISIPTWKKNYFHSFIDQNTWNKKKFMNHKTTFSKRRSFDLLLWRLWA